MTLLDVKLVFCGKAKSGKTTLASLFAEALKSNYTDTGEILVELLQTNLKISKETIKADKEKFRSQLIQLGDQICENNPSALAEFAFGEANIISGVRKIKEVESLRLKFPGLILIWVDREDVPEVIDNRDLVPSDCDLVVRNFENRLPSIEEIRDHVRNALSVIAERI